MDLENIVWLITLLGPIFGFILLVILSYSKERISMDIRVKTVLSMVIGLSLGFVGFVLVNIISDTSFSDNVKITADWYWFLLILSPLTLVAAYIMQGSKPQGRAQFYSTTVAIITAFIVSSFLILFAKGYDDPDTVDQWIKNPIKAIELVMDAYETLINSALGISSFDNLLDGNPANDEIFYRELGRSIGLATPLIFTALVFAFSFKAGLFNIGAEGAFTLGGFVGAVVGVWLPDMLPFTIPKPILSIIHIPLAFLCAAIVGAIFGAIPGILKAYLGAHEVITTIMLNPVAALIVFILVKNREYYSIQDLRVETPFVPDTCKLPHILPGPLGTEYFIALSTAILLFFFLFRTTYGLEIRAIGENSTAAEYAGIPVKKRQVQVMALSGAIGAIGGAGLSIGYYHYFNPTHPTGMGFDGIAVSVLAMNGPLAIIFVGILFGGIKNGGESLAIAMNIPKDLIEAIRGIIILFAAIPMVFMFLFTKKGHKEKAEEPEDRTASVENTGKVIEIEEQAPKE
ncbi:MAG: ABC transporter permease [Candidatus Hodarchaeota archaeon]